jgi:hypothetical protein
MDQYKGILRIEIAGIQRGFKFGTMQAALFCKEMNAKLSDMSSIIDDGNIEAQITWYWCAALSYARLFKEIEPSKDEVAAWIDTYGFDKMELDTEQANKVPNAEAPANLGTM